MYSMVILTRDLISLWLTICGGKMSFNVPRKDIIFCKIYQGGGENSWTVEKATTPYKWQFYMF